MNPFRIGSRIGDRLTALPSKPTAPATTTAEPTPAPPPEPTSQGDSGKEG